MWAEPSGCSLIGSGVLTWLKQSQSQSLPMEFEIGPKRWRPLLAGLQMFRRWGISIIIIITFSHVPQDCRGRITLNVRWEYRWQAERSQSWVGFYFPVSSCGPTAFLSLDHLTDPRALGHISIMTIFWAWIISAVMGMRVITYSSFQIHRWCGLDCYYLQAQDSPLYCLDQAGITSTHSSLWRLTTALQSS